MSNEYYTTTFCVECGPDVKVDEDGCCTSCGGAAIGPYAEKYHELETEVERWKEGYDSLQQRAGEILTDYINERNRAETAEAKLAAIEGLPEKKASSWWKRHSYQEGYVHGWNSLKDVIHAILRGEGEGGAC